MLLKFLDINYYTEKLKPVSSSIIFTHADKFHEEGLFSEEIFGKEKSPERRTLFSYLNLNTYVLHPTAYNMLIRLDRRIKRFLESDDNFSLDNDGNLVEDENGVSGIEAFIKIFPKIKLQYSSVTEKYVEVLKKSYKDGVLFINKVPVIPPSFREITKNLDTNEINIDPLNDYYLTILKRSFSIKSVVQPGPLLDILVYGMQKAVIDLDSFIKTKLSKKFGLIRNQLLGKRIDFSARAVITNGPELKVNEIGIPFRMAVTLFEPFIIHNLLYSGMFDKKELEDLVYSFINRELSIETIKSIIKIIQIKDTIPKNIEEIFLKATTMAVENRLVLAKRDPVLIPESVRAFKPIIINGNIVRLNNLQVKGFNADFDGDQMAIFHPLSYEAQEDAHKLLRSRTGENSQALSFGLNKESFLGIFLLTKDYPLEGKPKEITDKDLDSITDPTIPVVYKNKISTAGKIIFNYNLPKGFRFINSQVDKKIANVLISEIFNVYGEEEARECIFRLQTIGFKFATLVGSSISIDVFKMPDSILKLKKKLKDANLEDSIKIMAEMKKILINHLKGTGLYDLCESGASKGWDQPTQILVTKGIISDIQGNLLKIEGSFSDGLTPKEHFMSSLGSRKGIVDRVINTADTGYTSRQLAYLLNGVEIDWLLEDCKTERTLTLKLTDDLIRRLEGRYILENQKIIEFIPGNYKSGDVIKLRSPIFCKSMKLCHKCYGKLLEKHKTPYVGVLASQIIGERGTQLIMRSFHVGGAIKIRARDVLLEFSENDPYLTRSKINTIFKQENDKIIVLKPGTLTLSLLDYTLNSDLTINEDESNITLKSLLGIYKTKGGESINVILDASTIVLIQSGIKNDKKEITLDYIENEEIFEIPIEKEELKELVLYMRRLIGGGEIFKDTTHFLMKLFRIYGGNISDMDLVHLEVLVSQCLRDKEKPILPSRVGKTPDDPIMFNLKKVVFSTSFLQGLAFENIGEAIRAGLTSDFELEESILERILTGKLIEEVE